MTQPQQSQYSPPCLATDAAYLWKDLKVQTGYTRDFWGIT